MSTNASAPQAGASTARPTRRFLAPEIIQISSMDCGVAAVACFLRGSGLRANYERLREACATDVDGTSIDTLEDIVQQVGIDGVQHLLPSEGILVEALPRLPVVAISRTPAGYPHFIVLWRKVGPFWQIMDPARGRRWVATAELRRELHTHTQRFTPEEFRAWAVSSSFGSAVKRRVANLVGEATAARLWDAATSDPSWRSIAALDAAARLTAALRADGGSRADWRKVLEGSFQAAVAEAESPTSVAPSFWSVRAAPDGRSVSVTGSVMLGSREARPPARTHAPDLDDAAYLRRSLSEPEPSLLALAKPLLQRSLWTLFLVLCVATTATLGLSLLEILAVRVALSELPQFSQLTQKLAVLGWVGSLFAFLLILELVLAVGQRRLGRTLEIRLRLALFGALPSLDDHFIRSRPTSDLAQRAQVLHLVRDLPAIGLTVIRGAGTILSTLVVIAMLDRWLAVLVAVSASVLGLVGYVVGVQSAEVERKLQSNGAALLHVFQDALLGVVPLRVHGAELALRSEHRSRLLPWAVAQRQRLSQSVYGVVVQGLLLTALLVLVLLRGHALFPDGTRLVMLLFWVLRIPLTAQALLGVVATFPIYRLALERSLEPVRGADPRGVAAESDEQTIYGTGKRGVRIRFQDVRVVAAGSTVLDGLRVTIEPGEHVGIVGLSGAGKSTLLSLVLGLRQPSRGEVFVDEKPLEGETLHALRRQTAWIDPGVQLWNDTFLGNLMYGQEDVPHRSLASVLELSDLVGVIEKLPEGFMTRIGSDGTLLSGGEGQRLRVGRALLNRRPRLALLDEPFRGLDRDLRQKMLADVRDVFCRETLIVVTHDVEHVAELDRVLVIEDGRVIEDGVPSELLRRSTRFRELFEGDLQNKEGVWSDAQWTRVRVEAGVANVTPGDHEQGSSDLLADEEPVG